MNRPVLTLKKPRRPAGPRSPLVRKNTVLGEALKQAQTLEERAPKPSQATGKTNPKEAAKKRLTAEGFAAVKAALKWDEVPLPRAIGIDKDVRAVLAGTVSHKARRRIMYKLMHSRTYLEALAAEGSRRYRLDGTVAEPVAEEHREYARKQLESKGGNIDRKASK